MRKTRKFPDMVGSIRRRKQMRKWYRKSLAFDRWYRIAFPRAYDAMTAKGDIVKCVSELSINL